MATKNLKYYMNLNWSYSIEKEDDYFIIRVNELPGVCSHGKTPNDALKSVREAMQGALELYLEQGDEIPEPIERTKFKGRILYRTSSERHYDLAKLAQRRHISMNKALDLVFDAGLNTVKNQ